MLAVAVAARSSTLAVQVVQVAVATAGLAQPLELPEPLIPVEAAAVLDTLRLAPEALGLSC